MAICAGLYGSVAGLVFIWKAPWGGWRVGGGSSAGLEKKPVRGAAGLRAVRGRHVPQPPEQLCPRRRAGVSLPVIALNFYYIIFFSCYPYVYYAQT